MKGSVWRPGGFRHDERVRFYTRLAGLLRHGVRLEEALTRLARADRHRHPRPWTRRLASSRGELLADRLGSLVPLDEALLLRAGERSGRLAEALALLAEHLERIRRLRSRLWGALAAPAVHTALLLVACVFIARRVVPVFVRAAPHARWHGAAAGFVGVSALLREPAVLVGLALVPPALGAGVYWSFEHFLPRWRPWLDRFPPWSLYRLECGGIWLLSVSALVASGCRLRVAVEESARGAGPWLRQRCAAVAAELDRGHGLGEALARSGHGFPDPEVVETLRCLGELPDFARTLERTARGWAEDAERAIAREARVLEILAYTVLVLALLAFTTGFVALNTQLGSAALGTP
jgi:type II secretory pathway component PulF